MLGREHGMIALFVFFIEAPLSPCHSMQNIRGLDCEDVWAVMIRIKRQILNSVIEAFSSIKSNTMGHSCKRNASPGQPSSCLFILGQRSASCFFLSIFFTYFKSYLTHERYVDMVLHLQRFKTSVSLDFGIRLHF